MAQHIKQVSGEPHTAQINLMQHQRMELPQHRHKRKSLMPNSVKVAVNCNTEMKHHTIRRSRATTSCQLQTNHHPQAITTSVQNVATQHIRKDSHAQQKVSVQDMSQIWALH